MAKKRGSGEGSVTKRKDGTWQGAVTIGRDEKGRQKRQYYYGKTRTEVTDKINKALNEISLGTFIDQNSNPTIKAWLHTWLWDYKRHSIKQTTFEQYETLLRVHAIPKIGDMKIAQLKPENLQNIYNTMFSNGTSARTIQLLNTVLHAALKQAVKNGIVMRNVTESVVLPKSQAKEMRVLTQKEQKVFMDAIKEDRMGVIYLFGMFSGLRRGELLSLMWSDVDWEQRTIKVERTLNRVKTYMDSGKKTKLILGEPKTLKSKRIIPLIDYLYQLLLEHKQKQEKEKQLAGDIYEDNNIIFATELGKVIDPGNFVKVNIKMYNYYQIRMYKLAIIIIQILESKRLTFYSNYACVMKKTINYCICNQGVAKNLIPLRKIYICRNYCA